MKLHHAYSSAILIIPMTATLLICGCGGATVAGNSNENLAPVASPTVVSFTASPSTTTAGSRVTLAWSTKNADTVTIDNGVGTFPASQSSVTVTPIATTTYSITAHGKGGASKSLSTSVKTTQPLTASVQLSTTPSRARAGDFVTINWATSNAESITFNPQLPLPPEQTAFVLPNGSTILQAPQTATKTTITYTATVTSVDGVIASGSASLTVLPPPPTLTFSADSTNIANGAGTTLRWITQNAVSLNIDNNVGTFASATGSVDVMPSATTNYTATATGGDGTIVQQQVRVSVSFITLSASPTSTPVGGTSTLTWSSPHANSVSIDNGIGTVSPAVGGSISTPKLFKTTAFTATATDVNGNTFTASANVSNTALQTIKHIIFLVQENRSFDNYFSNLGAYKASRGFANDVNLDYDPTVQLKGLQGISVAPFHQRTVHTDNVPPGWNASHFDLDSVNAQNGTQCTPLPNSNCKMDKFMLATNAFTADLARDPNGDRALGYYDERDLNYYYELATQFATSDRWFSPMLGLTVPNREYLFSATSRGNSDPPSSFQVAQFTWPTIFDSLDNANISWKYYYLDNGIFLAQWSTWTKNNGADQGKVRCIDEWFKILNQPNADATLPQVVFIERGGGSNLPTGCTNGALDVDEHPGNNVQRGASKTKQIIDALMTSAAWKSSVFILTYDEGGGLYDHVPPFNEVAPDSFPPNGASNNPGQFNQSGFRVPMIIVSPWVKPHFVSHLNRDSTAILKLIETRFGVLPLTSRDAAQDDMTEFFDFSNPAWLTPPVLPEQLTNGTDDVTLETAP